jgi:hypothetical protein
MRSSGSGSRPGRRRSTSAIAVVLDAVSQPIEPTRFAAARDSLEATYRGRRIPPSGVPAAVLGWRRAGFDGDPLLSTWPQLSRASGDEFAAFLRSFTAVAPIVTVHGDLDRIDVAALERLGEIQRLTLDDIFASE